MTRAEKSAQLILDEKRCLTREGIKVLNGIFLEAKTKRTLEKKLQVHIPSIQVILFHCCDSLLMHFIDQNINVLYYQVN